MRRAQRHLAPLPDDDAPLALIARDHGVPRLTDLTPAAAALGLVPGMSLADARAACPVLEVREAEPAADAIALEALAVWCDRYTPLVMLDGADGLALDITGCAHLMGGEAALLADLGHRLAAHGITARLATANRLPAAWAWARFGKAGILADERLLAQLPVAALRIPAELAGALGRLGLERVAQLATIPRRMLESRFGDALVGALDRFQGHTDVPFVPLRAPCRFTARIGWAEPIGSGEAVIAAALRLLREVCADLESAGRGARRLALSLWRVDGKIARIELGTAHPVRDPGRLLRLVTHDLDGLDLGFGVELMRLEAIETAALGAEQTGLAAHDDRAAVDGLLDQLRARLGEEAVVRPVAVDSHLPERAQTLAAPGEPVIERPWLAREPRPLRLLQQPEPATAIAEVPDGPPARLVWRGTTYPIVAAIGPETIAPEWWRDPAARTRAYWRITLDDGRTLWVYRDGAWGEDTPPVWRVHGLME